MPTMPLGLAILDNPLVLFLSGFTLLILFFWYFATDMDKRKRDVGSILIVGVTALCLLAIWPPSETIKGGIDIVGGSSFSLRVHPNQDDNGNDVAVTKEGVTQAITTIEKRLNTLGTKDLTIFQQGDDMIIVQMPGIEPEEALKVREILEKVAKLELKQVNLDGFKPGADGRTLAQQVLAGDEIVPGFKAYIHEFKDDDGKMQSDVLLLNRRSALGGSDVKYAAPNGFDQTKVDITLTGDGEDKMIALTKDMTPKRDRIAIVLDGKVMSAPVVISTPLGRQFVIEGMSGYEESKELSNALLNPLKFPLKVEEERSVSPTLGSAVVQQGIWAGIVGLAITFVFILIYYRVAGFIALIGLTLNILFLFGAMAMFGFTLTLPGIAGIILTIGMAVDANVLIYERMREEMAAGKSLGAAIKTAYEKAFSAIFDANITSLITSLILFWRASGTVKGFAVTLTIGLLASMFCALLITRVLFRWGQDSGAIKKLSFLSLIPTDAHFDFLGKRKIAATVSLSLLFVAIAAFGWKRDASLGIDFMGGRHQQKPEGRQEAHRPGGKLPGHRRIAHHPLRHGRLREHHLRTAQGHPHPRRASRHLQTCRQHRNRRAAGQGRPGRNRHEIHRNQTRRWRRHPGNPLRRHGRGKNRRSTEPIHPRPRPTIHFIQARQGRQNHRAGRQRRPGKTQTGQGSHRPAGLHPGNRRRARCPLLPHRREKHP